MAKAAPDRTTAANRREAQLGQRYFTVQQTAEYLGLCERSIRDMIADGRLKGYRLGGRVLRLRLDEIDKAMESGS